LSRARRRRWASQRIKQLTGETVIKARKIARDPFAFRFTGKLLVMANHRPIVDDHGHAFWRRLRVVPFTVTIPEAAQDVHLADSLVEQEAAGILSWAVRGLANYQRSGLGRSPEIEAAVSEYRQHSDEIASFLAESCEVGPARRVRPGEIFDAYRAWCTRNAIAAVDAVAWKTRLLENGFERVTVSGYPFWKGLDLSKASGIHTSVGE